MRRVVRTIALLSVGLLAGLIGGPAPAAAPVQSGEHPGFTRVAIAYAAAPGWTVTAVAGGWEFRTAGEAPGFDLARAFDLVGRSRLQALDAVAPDVLRITSGCDCHVQAWTFRGSIPILDIHDGPPRPGSAGIGPLAVATRTSPEPEPQPAPGLAEAVARASVPEPDLTRLPPLQQDGAAQRRARELEARLGEALGRAGAQDMLEPAASPAPGVAPGGGALPPGSQIPDSAPPEPLPDGVAAPEDRHVRIQTAVDRDSGLRPAPDPDLTRDGVRCPDPRQFALADWGALADGRPDFARWAGGLVDELGGIDRPAAEAAARYHLFLGFGAEAAQVLDLLPPTPELAVLRTLAALIDGRPAPPEAASWADCASPAALWGVLAAGASRRDARGEADAVVAAFRALPSHLRPVLAPRLITIFTAAGNAEAALRLRNLTEGRGGGLSGSAALASARLEQQLERPDKAERILAEALRGPAADSPELLLELAHRRLSRGARLSAAEAGALEAHAYQHRGTPLALKLQQVLAEAEIADASHAAAAARIAGLPAGPDTAALWRRLFDAAAAQAEPAELLRLTLPGASVLGWSAPDMATRAGLAARLLELGFAADALRLLEPPPGSGVEPAAPGPVAAEVQLLAARAELALGRAAAVLVRLADREDAQTYEILAQAQELTGAGDAARRLYALAGRTDEVRRLDQLAGLWTEAVPVAESGAAVPDRQGRRMVEVVGGPIPGAATDLADTAAAGAAGRDGGEGGDTVDTPPQLGPASEAGSEQGDDPYALAQRLIADSAEDRARVAALLAQ